MRLGRFIRILAAGGAVLAPLCAFGHAIEFLTARLSLLPDAGVRLEVTADHAFNPLIPDEAAALEALQSPLEVRVGGGWRSLGELGGPVVERHTDWARCAPPNLPPPPPESVHALVTATWQWRHPESELVFRVPKGRMHDVFLWQPASGEAVEGNPWMLLLAGDVTKGIPVQPQSWGLWKIGGAMAVTLLAAWCVFRRAKAGQRASAQGV